MAKKETRITKRQHIMSDYKVRKVGKTRFVYTPKSGKYTGYANVLVEITSGLHIGWYASDKGNQADTSYMTGPFANAQAVLAHNRLMDLATNRNTIERIKADPLGQRQV